MITYKYIARNSATGEKIISEVQASNKKSASQLIQQLGYVPIEINEQTSKSNLLSFFSRVKIKDRIIFSNQLSTLVSAGLPLVQSLRSVQEQTKNKYFQTIISKIITDVESGKPLSAALSKYPNVFSQVYVSLITSGETSGTLDKVLERLAIQQEKDAEIISKVRGAMIYPLMTIAVMIGVLAFMMVQVIPQIQKIYVSFEGAKLPLVTTILISISQVIVNYWWASIVFLAGLSLFIFRWRLTDGGRKKIDSLKLAVPPTNQLMKRLYMARFSRTAYTLVASGVPLIQVLEVTSHSINNVVIENSIKSAIEKVKGGKALSDSLLSNPYFLDLVPKMIKIGEQSGSLDHMLNKTAEYYEKEVDNQIKNISTTIEPVMMIVLGVAALFIVVAVLLPIYNLAGQTYSR